MTSNEINIAIAEACGWKHAKGFHWKNPNGLSMFEWDIYDYCNNLDAMHEAEKTIYNHNNLWTAYYYNIGAGPRGLHATARKKAEAFLRALGKWKEALK